MEFTLSHASNSSQSDVGFVNLPSTNFSLFLAFKAVRTAFLHISKLLPLKRTEVIETPGPSEG